MSENGRQDRKGAMEEGWHYRKERGWVFCFGWNAEDKMMDGLFLSTLILYYILYIGSSRPHFAQLHADDDADANEQNMRRHPSYAWSSASPRPGSQQCYHPALSFFCWHPSTLRGPQLCPHLNIDCRLYRKKKNHEEVQCWEKKNENENKKQGWKKVGNENTDNSQVQLLLAIRESKTLKFQMEKLLEK